jgi:hypothetical protein
MGIHILTAQNIRSYADPMEQAYRLRHAVFPAVAVIRERGWTDFCQHTAWLVDPVNSELQAAPMRQ